MSLIGTQTRYSDEVFKEKDLEQAQLVSSGFYDCTFVGCSFAEAVLRFCRFTNCTFQRCDLSLVQVPGSAFSLTRFEESKMISQNHPPVHFPRLPTVHRS
jgi:uncharacterized protein YjbI with pentapeptide repeats